MIVERSIISKKDEFIKACQLITNDSSLYTEFMLFDIETTGLSAASSFLYLIGFMYIKDDALVLTQLFSEGPSDELNLLLSFLEATKKFKYIGHFNGQTFDIPYLSKKCIAFGLQDPFTSMVSFDIYKLLKPFKSFLATNSMKQKALEQLAGLNRKDTYDGGELIDVYNRYLAAVKINTLRQKSGSSYKADSSSGLAILGKDNPTDLLSLLMLHNYEDILGMLSVANLLTIKNLMDGGFKLVEISFTDSHCHIRLKPNYKLPANILLNKMETANRDASLNNTHQMISLSKDTTTDDSLLLSLPIIETELKLFYKNYKDYYYIPGEDTAMHSSIACFLDNSLKKKATAATCYTRCNGRFIMLPFMNADTIWPVFKTDYKSKTTYCSLDSANNFTTETICGYLDFFTKSMNSGIGKGLEKK